jgi:hypothetical protein
MALGSLFPKLALTIPLLGSSASLRAGRKIDPMPEIVRSTTNKAWQINPLQLEYRLRSGNDLSETDWPLRERAGKIRVVMTQHRVCPSASTIIT